MVGKVKKLVSPEVDYGVKRIILVLIEQPLQCASMTCWKALFTLFLKTLESKLMRILYMAYMNVLWALLWLVPTTQCFVGIVYKSSRTCLEWWDRARQACCCIVWHWHCEESSHDETEVGCGHHGHHGQEIHGCGHGQRKKISFLK